MGGYNEQQAHSAKGGATRLSLLGELAVILSTVKGLVGLDLDVASLLLRCRDFLNMSVPFLLVTEAVLGQMAHDTTALLSTRKWPIHSANCQGVLRERESVRKMSVLDLYPLSAQILIVRKQALTFLVAYTFQNLLSSLFSMAIRMVPCSSCSAVSLPLLIV